jgi:hypothetical protein
MLRLQHDMEAAGRDLEHLDITEATEGLAGAVRREVPVVSGYLQSTVFADSTGVGVGAVYAGVVHDSNPYTVRALDGYDVTDPIADQVDQVIGAHLSPLYV